MKLEIRPPSIKTIGKPKKNDFKQAEKVPVDISCLFVSVLFIWSIVVDYRFISTLLAYLVDGKKLLTKNTLPVQYSLYCVEIRYSLETTRIATKNNSVARALGM